MTDDEPREPAGDQLPEQVLADIHRWRAAQPEIPDLLLRAGGDRQEGSRRQRRRHSRRLLPLGAAAAAALVAVGAVAIASSTGHDTPQAGKGVGKEVGIRLVGNVHPVTLGSITPQAIARAQTAFGLDLLARQCAAAPTANDVLSPASAALVLAMLDTGAAGSTRQALSGLLHLPAWSPQLVAALHDQHQALTGLEQLKVSNHIYTQLGVHPRQQVLDNLATAAGAYLQTLDFAGHAPQATDVINDAVNADTRGLIRKLFDIPLDPNTTTVLTNALYLDAAWKTPFLPASPAPFHTADGRTVTAPLMSSVGEVAQVRRTAGWTAATLPYAGGKLEAVVLLPANTSDDVARAACAAPTAAQLTALTSGPAADGSVEMPTLHLEQTNPLKADLAALGLPLDGDYSGFGSTGAISQVVQKTVLQVDEHGTKAAAATGVSIATSASLNDIVANQPYLLLIRDVTTGTPLFLARINDPTATG